MFRTSIIALTLALASVPSARAQEAMGALATAGNKHTAGNQQDTRAIPKADDLYPDAVICAVAVHGAAPGSHIPVPVGRKPTDICPRNALTAVFFHVNSTGDTRIPVIPGAWPLPADAAAIEKEQNDLADAELRALKLRNKTPAPQTPKQQTSGQPP